MALINYAAVKLAEKRVAQIEKHAANPLPIQEKQLRYLLNKAQHTAFGKHYHFSDIRTIEEYQQAVPLVDYEGIKDWWAQYFDGKTDVTWPGKTTYWGLSSGTTSGNKLLPITMDTIRTNRLGGRDSLAYYLVRSQDYKLLQGKMLFLGGSTTLRPNSGRTFIGDNTGIMARHMPFYTKRYYSPGLEIATLSDWEEKIARVIDLTSRQDIRMISGIPSWISLLLERLLNHTGKGSVREVWPNLSVYIHGGMSFKPFKATFQQLIGKDIYYVDTFSATEGGMLGIQDQDDDSNMILITDLEVFYEFVPEEDLQKEHPRRLTVEQVEVGKNYAIVVSTNAGIWSYIIGDLIQFVELNPHRYFFAGRTKTSLNAFGEHVIQEEMDAAIAHACELTGAIVKDFTVIPFYPDKKQIVPRHRWLVEFRQPPTDMQKFMHEVDLYIQSRNEDYETHRKDNFGVDAPELIVVSPNTFYKWMEVKGKIGGQHKLPRVMHNEQEFNLIRQISDEIK